MYVFNTLKFSFHHKKLVSQKLLNTLLWQRVNFDSGQMSTATCIRRAGKVLIGLKNSQKSGKSQGISKWKLSDNPDMKS